MNKHDQLWSAVGKSCQSKGPSLVDFAGAVAIIAMLCFVVWAADYIFYAIQLGMI